MMDVLREREQRSDQRTALQCATIVNMLKDPSAPFASVDDFMPTFQEPGRSSKVMTDEEMLLQVKMINAAFGGDVIDNV